MTRKRFGSSAILLVVSALIIVSTAACSARAPSFDAVPYSGEMAAPASAEYYAEAGIIQDAGGALSERRVISTARLDLVVADAGETADRIAELVAEVGGYVGGTNLYKTRIGDRETLRGTVSVRVPSESLDAVIEQLEALAVDVRSKSTERQDVTDQFSDLEAQLRTLRATEQELLELLAEVRAKPNATADEIMAVYYRLTEIRTEIERLQGRLNLIDNQVRLSTIEVSLIPDASGLPIVQVGWQPGAEARAALRTLVSATQGLANLLIWAALFIAPLLLILLIPVVVVLLAVRGWYRRSKRAKAPAQPA